MTEEETNVTGVTEDTYASMLGEAIKSKDAEIASLKAAQAARVKELTDMVLNGATPEEAQESSQVLPSRLECYKKYKENKFSTDLEYWKNFLELRDATIREYGKDPCVTGNYGVDVNGNHVDPEYGEPEEVEEMFNTIREIIDESNGDPAVFNLKMKSAIK